MPFQTNSDGLTRNYGIPTKNQEALVGTKGVRNELVVLVNFNDLPAPRDGSAYDNSQDYIPKGAVVESCKLITTVAWAGGTNLTLGFNTKANAAIDADGIDVTIATAALTANSVIVCDGVVATNAIVSATADAYITAATTGTYTAGQSKLVITYLVPSPK